MDVEIKTLIVKAMKKKKKNGSFLLILDMNKNADIKIA